MLLAAVVQFQSDLAKRFFIIDNEFFGPFNFLQDKVPLDRLAFDSRKQAAKVLVVFVNVLREIIGQVLF